MTAQVRGEFAIDANKPWLFPILVDSGAGVNVVKTSTLPKGWQPAATIGPTRHVPVANGAVMRTRGEILLWIRIGTHIAQERFIVIDNLPIPLLAGMGFQRKHVRHFSPMNNTIEMANGSVKPLLHRVAGQKMLQCNALPIFTIDRPKPTKPTAKVQIKHKCVIPPRSQVVVTITANAEGVAMINPVVGLMESEGISLPNVVVKLRKKTSKMLIANFTERQITLPKNRTIGTLNKEDTPLVHTNISIQDVLGIDIPSENDKEVDESNANSEARKMVDDLPLPRVLERLVESAKRMLKRHARMWNGHLGRIEAARHHIELVPGANPFKQQPYRQGPKGRMYIDKEIRKQLSEGVIQPSKSEWGSPMVLESKQDGSLRFCVDFRKLNSLTVRDKYPIPRMDECLDSLEDEQNSQR